MHKALSLPILLVAVATSAAAQSVKPAPTLAVLLSEGYEIKAVVSGSYLVLQKGSAAYFCGTGDAALTWSNWAASMREAKCEGLNK